MSVFHLDTNQKGRTATDLVLYMALLLIVGLLVFSLAGSGSEAYVSLSGKSRNDSAVRTAVTYIDKAVRKNDTLGMPKLLDNPFGNGQAIFYTTEFDEYLYETWIYCRDGSLYELFKPAEEKPEHELALRITDIELLELWLEDGLLRVRATSGPASLSAVIYLRSGG